MMTREEALSRIRMNPKMVPAGQDPEAFIAAMMAADAANSAPMTPPVEVSPADPAPVQAGIPIVAPPPMAPPMPPPMPPMATDFRNQAILAANQTRPPGTDLISGNSGQDVLLGSAGKDVVVPPAPAGPPAPVAPPAVAPPKLSLTPEEQAKLLQGGSEVIKKAREGATLSEEQKEYFDAVRQRTDAELADVGKERKQQYWMALALAGAKMAQSQSPYFATALAEGLESGLTGFNKARADASEKKARLQTRKEDLILKRVEALKSAQRDAVADMTAGYEVSKNQMELLNSADERLLNLALSDSKYNAAMANTRTAVAQAKTAEIGAQYEEQKIKAGLNLINAQTNSAMASAAQSFASAELSRATIRQGVQDGNIPKGVYEIYNSNQTTHRQLLESADKLGPGEPGYQSLMDQAASVAKQSKLLIAPYTAGISEENPVSLGRGEQKKLPEGYYFTRAGVPGVFQQKANAGSPVSKGRAAGAGGGTGKRLVYDPKTKEIVTK